MTSIRFLLRDGEVREVRAADGVSLMKVGVENDIPGIVGECGGEMSCATCHVYVPPAAAALLPPASEDETDLLELAENTNESSRLGCQIPVVPELDGLTFEVADEG